MSLGRNLTILMYDKGITARQLARRVGVCESLISKIKKGERTATPLLISEIAEVLGVNVSELSQTGSN